MADTHGSRGAPYLSFSGCRLFTAQHLPPLRGYRSPERLPEGHPSRSDRIDSNSKTPALLALGIVLLPCDTQGTY